MKMSKRSKIMELLEKITDIEKDCSVCYKQEIFVIGNNMKTDAIYYKGIRVKQR